MYKELLEEVVAEYNKGSKTPDAKYIEIGNDEYCEFLLDCASRSLTIRETLYPDDPITENQKEEVRKGILFSLLLTGIYCYDRYLNVVLSQNVFKRTVLK